MRKKLLTMLIVIIFLMLHHQAVAQKIMISFGTEYGTYSMKQMRSFQNELRTNLPVPAKNTHEFPAYWGYVAKFYLTHKRFQFGVNGGFNSTGSRVSYADYSGSILYDQNARMTHIGIGCEFRLTRDAGKLWETFISMQTEWGMTKYRLNSFLELDGTTVVDQQLDFKSNNILVNPSFIVKRIFFGKLFIAAHAGFLIDIGESLKYKQDRKLFLLNKNHEAVGTDWSGVRIGISGGIRL